jgi:hypothetical protein
MTFTLLMKMETGLSIDIWSLDCGMFEMMNVNITYSTESFHE